jgi:acetyl-CoA/propionyl-CoA carboxylase biotin carboxyl carrier protein
MPLNPMPSKATSLNATPLDATSGNPEPGGTTLFGTVLVANRGEIACRVIGTLRRLGIRSVAVYSDADAGARHVREADVAVRIGPAPAARSYLDVDAVVAAAVATGAQAIHPGYGFLSENPALARACERAGIVFVGPSTRALEVMADKVAAKRLVASHGVPVLPGTMDDGLDDDALVAAARDVGFPLLVKPVAGGGGKGMTVVREAGALVAALESARRVAASSFGDDGLLIERLVERPRHIEVQVLADSHGDVVHLGERECTLQRRHQKVIEEAPSPAVDAATRVRLGEAACEVARSVGYVGVGTVEFLVPADDPASFWFIEMNTRLQVEHPVTELVTGFDLVEQQLRVAAGERLGFSQDDVQLHGHAVEARVYAESPERGFLPSTGRVLVYDDARVGAGPGASPLRLDSGIAGGEAITGDYDPLLAKAITWAPSRDEALARLDGLLGSVAVLGVGTNAGFLRDLLADADVRAGRLDTGLLDRFVEERSDPARATGDDGSDMRSVAAAAVCAREAFVPSRPAGPWAADDGWRLNGPPSARRLVVVDRATTGPSTEHTVRIEGPATAAVVTVDDEKPVAVSLRPADPGQPHRRMLTVDGVTEPVTVAVTDAETETETGAVWVHRAGRTASYTVLDRAAQAARRRAAAGRSASTSAAVAEVRAGMPGTVTAVPVADGDTVAAGATVVVVEAMKMEHPLTAPRGGMVRVSVRPGDQVRLDQVVAVVDAPETSSDGSSDSGPGPEAPPVPEAVVATSTDAPGGQAPGTADPAVPVTHSETRGAS